MKPFWFRKSFYLVFSLLTFCCISLSSAEIIELKSGQRVEAPIVTRTDEYIKVDTGVGVVITYYLDEINKITASEMKAKLMPLQDPKSIEFEQYQKYLRKQLEVQRKNDNFTSNALTPPPPASIDPVDHQIQDIETTVDNLDKDFPQEMDKIKSTMSETISIHSSKVKRSINVLRKLTGLEMIANAILPSKWATLMMASWFIACLPTMVLARRLKYPYFWMAWIPVGQIYLLVRLAQRPLWWFYHVFTPIVFILIPFYFPVQNHLGWFFCGIFLFLIHLLIIPTLLWCQIARDVGQPFWWGLLTALPIANVITIHLMSRNYVDQREEFLRRIVPQVGNKN